MSCDSLQPDRFGAHPPPGRLATVLAAMDAAEAAGLVPVKVNVVFISGVNDDEVLDFAAFARRHGRIVRFIEFMPLDAEGRWRRDQVVPSEDVLARINASWPIEAVKRRAATRRPPSATGSATGGGEIGVVASVTRPFLWYLQPAAAHRRRRRPQLPFLGRRGLAAHAPAYGGSDEDIALALRRSVWGKLPGHGINDPGFLRPSRSMSMIGG